jgi:hypothetical protein
MEMNNMAMRSQIYEWDASRTDGGGNAITASGANQDGQRLSIFVGGFGNNITKPAETTATEFVVIEDISISPTAFMKANNGAEPLYRGLTQATGLAGGRSFCQVRINTTDYFLDPDNIPNDGIPGTASPYPRSIDFQPSFNLYPDVYVLPGQVWDVLATYYNASGFAYTATTINAGQLQCFVKYTLYDGPDALIANKLLEMGISINPGNVDWYKRSLLGAQ